MKNKLYIAIASIIVFFLVIFLWLKGTYNSLVEKDQNVQSKWSNVETVYQKRANLVPNLERTVKSYAKFEKETLTGVVEARAKASSVNVDPTNMTEADLARFQQAQGQLGSALGRLMVIVERYPELKADQQYINFQREYTAIENSIRAETVYFNEATKDYNTYRNSFPKNVIAGFCNFLQKPYFRAEVGTEKAPDVFQED